MSGRWLAVLSYHKIGPPPPSGWETWFYVSQRRLVKHLRHLSDDRWQFLDLSTLLAGLEDPERLPPRGALITFDDGYRSLVDYALPVLERFDCPGVVFVPTAFVGGVNNFERASSEPEERICSWDDLRKLERSGIAIESHGVHHRSFSELTDPEIEEELTTSKQELETRLDKTVESFAFPYGDPGSTPTVPAMLERVGYRAAFVYAGGPFMPGAEPRYGLPRVEIGSNTDVRAVLGHAFLRSQASAVR